jgi:hypothetical protein
MSLKTKNNNQDDVDVLLNKFEEENKKIEQNRIDLENSKWIHFKLLIFKLIFFFYYFFETLFKAHSRPDSSHENNQNSQTQRQNRNFSGRPSHFKYRSRGGG